MTEKGIATTKEKLLAAGKKLISKLKATLRGWSGKPPEETKQELSVSNVVEAHQNQPKTIGPYEAWLMGQYDKTDAKMKVADQFRERVESANKDEDYT